MVKERHRSLWGFLPACTQVGHTLLGSTLSIADASGLDISSLSSLAASPLICGVINHQPQDECEGVKELIAKGPKQYSIYFHI